MTARFRQKWPVTQRGGMKLFLASRDSPLTRSLEVLRGSERVTVKATLRAGADPPDASDLPAAGRTTLAALQPFRGPVGPTLSARFPR